MSKRNKTNFPGVRYREHPTRKHGVQRDRYFSIRYRLDSKAVEEGVGWASEGYTPTDVYELLAELKRNHKTGTGHRTLAEKRELAEQDRQAAELAKQEAERLEMIEAQANKTFADLFEAYFESCQTSKGANSLRTERYLFAKFISPAIGQRTLKALAPLDLERIKSGIIKAGKSPRTSEYALAVVRQVINFAKRNRLFDGASPIEHVKPPRFDNRRLRFLTRDEAEALLTELKRMSLEVHDQALLSLHTGARAGEVLNLTWQDVDLDRNTLTLRDTKNAKTRMAFLNTRSAAMLAARRGDKFQPTQHVFQGRDGRASSISRTFDRAVEHLGLNQGITDRRWRVCFHTLRHTAASWMVEAGVSLYAVKEVLGHSDFRMTARYAHLNSEALHDAVGTLAGHGEPAPVGGEVLPFKRAAGGNQ